MELIKIILLFLCGLVQILSLKVDTYSQAVLNSLKKLKSNSKQEVERTEMIEVFNDKGLTQKTISFDNIGYYTNLNSNGIKDGLVFTTDKSNNAGIASNYFSDKGEKLPDATKFLIRYSNFFKCEVFTVPRPALNYDIVQIGVMNKNGTATYMSLSYGTSNKDDKNVIADRIAKECKEYNDDLKRKMNDFWKEVSTYWNTKKQVKQLADQIKQLSDQYKTENDKLEQITSDKEGFEKNLKITDEELKKTKIEMNDIETKLKEEYKIVSDLKTRKADNEKNLTNLNATLSKMYEDTDSSQKKLDGYNKESDQLRAKAEDLIKQLTEVKSKMAGLELNLTDEKNLLNEVNGEIDLTNKQINENGKIIADYNKDIKTNRDFLDKLAIEDLPNNINKTKTLIDGYEKASEKTMNQTDSTDLEIQNANKTIIAAKSQLKAILSDKKIIKNAKKAKIKKNIETARAIFETFRKIFPILPDVFMNNMWTFNSLTHYEAMNYIQAVKPSFYGMYDFVFGPNDPAVAKAEATKKRRMKKLKKLRKLKKL
jgi:predicted  nucleic acid-binding Zn-ribbon protein